jgi:SOS-response transcriptional repressor LexA
MSVRQDKSVPRQRREKATEVRIGEFGIDKARYLDMRAAAMSRKLPNSCDLSLQERLVFAWLVLIFEHEDNEIEELIGRSIKQFWRYVEGQDVPLKILLRICEVTDIPESYLVLGQHPDADKFVQKEGQETVFVRLLAFQASAGSGASIRDDEERTVPFANESLERAGVRPQNARLLYAAGDSMRPTIEDGEPLLVDVGDTDIIDGRIYVFSIGDQVLVKRLRRLGSRLLMRADNRDLYPDEEEVPMIEPVRVIGRVKWVGRSL